MSQITEKDVNKAAKRIFYSMIDFVTTINNLGFLDKNTTNNYGMISEMISSLGINLISPKFDKNKKLGDNFKIMCVYILGFEKLVGKKISFSDYIVFRNIAEVALRNNDQKIGVESALLKMFDVNPEALPVSHRQKISSIDEVIAANDIIASELGRAKESSSFEEFSEYKSYMQDIAMSIISKLHDKGMYGTHDQDRMTSLCLARKIGSPELDLLYKKGESDRSPIPTSVIEAIAEKAFNLMNNYQG